MGVSVLPAPVYELLVVPRQESDGVEWFHVLVRGLGIERPCLLACCYVVGIEGTNVLVAVDFVQVERLPVGCPADVGKVPVCRVACLQVCDLLRCQVEDSHVYLVGCHASHGVFVGRVFSLPCKSVYLRVVCHHRLVHAIESQLASVWTPECTLGDAEFVTVYALAVYHLP